MSDDDTDDVDISEIFKGVDFLTLFDALHGISAEERAELNRRSDAAEKLEGLLAREWPPFEVKWDLHPNSHRFALDGCGEEEFNKHYQNGFVLKRVLLQDLDDALCAYNRRTPEEVWGIGTDRKAAKVLLDWIEGRKLTPPLVNVLEETNELCLNGGNHRLAVARAKGETIIPILMEEDNVENISRLIAFYNEIV